MSGKSQTTLIILFEEELRAMATAMLAVCNAFGAKDEPAENAALNAFFPVAHKALYHLMAAPPDACVVLGRLPRKMHETAIAPKDKAT